MDDLPAEQKYAYEVFERESKDGIIEISQLADALRMTNLVITGMISKILKNQIPKNLKKKF